MQEPSAEEPSGGPHLQVVCAIIQNGAYVLVAQRSPDQSLPLKWEFPGGKIEPGETAEEALIREIREELGVELEVGAALAPVTHAYPGFSLTLHPRLCRIRSGTPVAREHARIQWLEPESLTDLDWAPADLPVLADYLALGSHSPCRRGP